MSGLELVAKHLNACNKCAARKVRCDKQEPCSTCQRSGAECIYPAIVHRPRKRRFQCSHEALLGKLREYEDLLRGAGVPFDPFAPSETSAETPNVEPPSCDQHRVQDQDQYIDRQSLSQQPDKDHGSDFNFPIGGLVVNPDGSRSYEHSMLMTLSKEFSPHMPHAESTSTSLGRSLLSQIFRMPFRPSQSALIVPAADEDKLWSTFLSNVDPLTKVIHWPTIDKLRKRRQSGEPTSKHYDALLCSIYACSLISIKETECHAIYGHSQAALIIHYTAAAWNALHDADFLHSLDLMTVQALSLLLTSIQHLSEPSYFWSLLGIVIRKAQTIGLHRDGANLGLSLYECELRRRVWWYLVGLDTRASELAGAASSVISQPWDTRLPANIDDQDLYPELDVLPPNPVRLTSMSFCLFQFETLCLLRSTYFDASQKNLSKNSLRMPISAERISDFRKFLEDKFLRFCDPVIPIHFMLNAFVRLTLCKLEAFSLGYHARTRKMQPPSYPDSRATYGLRMLEYDSLLHSNPSARGFRWFMYAHFSWGALIMLLQSMPVKNWGAAEENMWCHVENIFNRYPQMYLEDRGLHRLVSSLVLRVWGARQASRQQGVSQPAEPAPSFIANLQSKPHLRSDIVSSSDNVPSGGLHAAASATSEQTRHPTDDLEQPGSLDDSFFSAALLDWNTNLDFSAWLT
ncbi:fungal-specific transcription factor domain-containing protein [Aspergillus multicolor]|uniref:Zn(II)2Cys6 transcription factor n=1 Tax=Aspergillus multicolor TaxID=41759 RepID=UPI003CCD21F5